MQETENTEEMKQQLIEMLGIGALPQEEQDPLLEKIMEALMRRIFVATAEKLDAEALEAYKQLLDGETSEEDMRQFLEKNIPDYNTFVESVSREFLDQMKQAAEKGVEE